MADHFDAEVTDEAAEEEFRDMMELASTEVDSNATVEYDAGPDDTDLNDAATVVIPFFDWYAMFNDDTASKATTEVDSNADDTDFNDAATVVIDWHAMFNNDTAAN